jgi:hypothetical protein
LLKMVLQGLAAAALIGGGAVVYAQVQDNGYLSAPQTKSVDNPGPKEGAKEHARRKGGHERDRVAGGRQAGEDE